MIDSETNLFQKAFGESTSVKLICTNDLNKYPGLSNDFITATYLKNAINGRLPDTLTPDDFSSDNQSKYKDMLKTSNDYVEKTLPSSLLRHVVEDSVLKPSICTKMARCF